MKSKGFSLIELLVVVAAVSVVASLAVPNFVRSQTAANEGSAINSVRILVTGQVTYATTAGAGQYGTLSQLGSAGIIDTALAGGSKHQYEFTVTPIGNSGFTVIAVPSIHGLTGNRSFYSDDTMVVRYTADGSTPSSSSPPLTGH